MPPPRRLHPAPLRAPTPTAPAAAQFAQRAGRGAALALGEVPVAGERAISPTPASSPKRPPPETTVAREESSEARVVLLRPPAAQQDAQEISSNHTPVRSEELAARTTPLGHPAARLPEGTRLTPSAQSAGRPPVLASEALRKDLAPATPAGPQVRRAIVAVGLAGAALSIALGGGAGLGLPLSGAFLALAVLGLVPMPYQARAAAIVTVSGTALAIVTWSRLERARDLEPLVLLIGVLLLSTALLFRSWHRASLLARALVALGAILCGGWLGMSHGLQQLLILEAGWQQWLPAVLPLPLAILLMLSLLAFMDSRSTGGCSAWASLVLAWYSLQVWVELIPLYWPVQSRGLALDRGSADVAVTVLSGPLFAVVLAAGLAQLLSVATAEPE